MKVVSRDNSAPSSQCQYTELQSTLQTTLHFIQSWKWISFTCEHFIQVSWAQADPQLSTFLLLNQVLVVPQGWIIHSCYHTLYYHFIQLFPDFCLDMDTVQVHFFPKVPCLSLKAPGYFSGRLYSVFTAKTCLMLYCYNFSDCPLKVGITILG